MFMSIYINFLGSFNNKICEWKSPSHSDRFLRTSTNGVAGKLECLQNYPHTVG